MGMHILFFAFFIYGINIFGNDRSLMGLSADAYSLSFGKGCPNQLP